MHLQGVADAFYAILSASLYNSLEKIASALELKKSSLIQLVSELGLYTSSVGSFQGLYNIK